MGRKVWAIIEETIYTAIEVVASGFVVLIACACSIALDKILRPYLSGSDQIWFIVVQTISWLALTVLPAIHLYGKVRILWIQIHSQIRKAEEESNK